MTMLGCKGSIEESRSKSIQIAAHRGASHLAPENTIVSARLAWKLGADAVECDVQQTIDGEIVVIHDLSTDRVSGEHLWVGKTPWRRLKGLDVGSHMGTEYVGEEIPTLYDFLMTLPEGKSLLLEVKSGPEILEGLERVLARSGKQKQVVLMSFRLEVLVLAKRRWPKMTMVFLKKAAQDFSTGKRLAHGVHLIEIVQRNNLDGLGLDVRGFNEEIAREAKRAGLLLYVWTVDDPAVAGKFVPMGVDVLITNRPGWMRKRM